MRRVEAEQDDVLCTLVLVDDDAELRDRLWSQLVDLLVEASFLDLRERLLSGRLARDDYVAELTNLANQCRSAGLLPLPTRGSFSAEP